MLVVSRRPRKELGLGYFVAIMIIIVYIRSHIDVLFLLP